jgi:hypothetical protein
MTKIRKYYYILLLGVSICLLLGCSQSGEPEIVEPTATTAPVTNTPLPPTPTEIPPTETPVPPTETPIPPTETPSPTPLPPTKTPTPEPTEPLPEFQVMNYEELVGKWQAANRVKDYTVFQDDGVSKYLDRNGVQLSAGLARIENGILIIDSNECAIADASAGTVSFESCTATYKVYLSKDGDIPVCLRFEVIEDPDGMRQSTVTGPLWCWYEE